MMTDIQEKIENANYYKFQGVAPEGFILVPLEVLEELKDFDTWKEWKHDPELLKEKIKKFCNSI